jgi:hypothetical protein
MGQTGKLNQHEIDFITFVVVINICNPLFLHPKQGVFFIYYRTLQLGLLYDDGLYSRIREKIGMFCQLPVSLF